MLMFMPLSLKTIYHLLYNNSGNMTYLTLFRIVSFLELHEEFKNMVVLVPSLRLSAWHVSFMFPLHSAVFSTVVKVH